MEFLQPWRTNPTAGVDVDWKNHLTSSSQFHAGNHCSGGFGASFVAINPNCNPPSLSFRNTDVGCLRGSESERNNSHIPVLLCPRRGGQRPGLSFPELPASQQILARRYQQEPQRAEVKCSECWERKCSSGEAVSGPVPADEA